MKKLICLLPIIMLMACSGFTFDFGEIEGRQYSNNFFDLEINFPIGWQNLNQSFTTGEINVNKKSHKKVLDYTTPNKKRKEIDRALLFRTKSMYFSQSCNLVAINKRNLGYKNGAKLLEDIIWDIESGQKTFLEAGNASVPFQVFDLRGSLKAQNKKESSEIQELTIAGESFHKMEISTFQNYGRSTQIYYTLDRSGYILLFSFANWNDEDLSWHKGIMEAMKL